MRLDKYLCQLNIGSRSQVKAMIRQNLVTVNGLSAISPEQKINEHADLVTFRGAPLQYRDHAYYMMYKPAGVVTAVSDSVEQTVLDILKPHLRKEDAARNIVPAGRLDKDTEGLLLLTDDGALIHNLLSPGKHVEKTYLVTLAKPLAKEAANSLEKGVDIGEKHLTAPAKVEQISDLQVYLTIHEGKFHQVKRMMQAVQNEVTGLKRIRFGSLVLDESLNPGECRALTESEQTALCGGQII